MSYQEAELVNWTDFAKSRSELGTAFLRILGYFREDGEKAISAIEEAFRARNAAALVTPAHTLKGESRQFGAYRLSVLAEKIEMVARRCVESREGPDEGGSAPIAPDADQPAARRCAIARGGGKSSAGSR